MPTTSSSLALGLAEFLSKAGSASWASGPGGCVGGGDAAARPLDSFIRFRLWNYGRILGEYWISLWGTLPFWGWTLKRSYRLVTTFLAVHLVVTISDTYYTNEPGDSPSDCHPEAGVVLHFLFDFNWFRFQVSQPPLLLASDFISPSTGILFLSQVRNRDLEGVWCYASESMSRRMAGIKIKLH